MISPKPINASSGDTRRSQVVVGVMSPYPSVANVTSDRDARHCRAKDVVHPTNPALSLIPFNISSRLWATAQNATARNAPVLRLLSTSNSIEFDWKEGGEE